MAERKGKKLRRCTATSKAYYKVQFGKTDSNKKKGLSRHIRSHPSDRQAITRYEKDMGYAEGLLASLSRRGKRRSARAAT